MDFVDCANLALLLSQHACLQLNHSLRLTGSRFRSIRSLRLQVDSRREPPPDQACASSQENQGSHAHGEELPAARHLTTSSAAA